MKKRLWLLVPAALILAAAIYVNDYYRADDVSLASDEVRVEQTDYGWRFDGPSEDVALVFYPGGKVEETAYAPLLRGLAAAGMDACLVKAPLRLAILDVNAADMVMRRHDYARWYVGGHSLGGAAAAMYAAGHPADLEGLILLAAYPAKPLDERLNVISIHGSEDGVLNRQKYADARQYLPAHAVEHVIEGGNHAQFGSYGPQKGDGLPAISAEQQRQETVGIIMGAISG